MTFRSFESKGSSRILGKNETGSARHELPYSMVYCPEDMHTFHQLNNTTWSRATTSDDHTHECYKAMRKHNGKVGN